MVKDLIIYGGGGHARTILEHISRDNVVGVVDNNLSIGTPVLFTRVVAHEIEDINFSKCIIGIGGIESMIPRKKAYRKINAWVKGFQHPKAYIETNSLRQYVDHTAHLMAGCYIGSDCIVGYNTIINTGAIISHDCKIGPHTHICPGAILAGNVKVGSECIIGMGVTIHQGVTIGDKIKIYNGTHVFKDILTQDQVPVPGKKVETGY